MIKTTLTIRNPRIAPMLLTVGMLVWKAFEHFAHIDFFVSSDDATFLSAFHILAEYGWWIVALIGAVWLLTAWNHRSARWAWISAVTAIVVVTASWAIALTAYATGEVPRVLMSFDTRPPHCKAQVDMSRLQSFAGNYDVVLICGLVDPTIDKLKTTVIAVSQPYPIRPTLESMTLPMSEAMRNNLLGLSEGTMVSTWHEAALLPKTAYLGGITTLGAVVKQGGRIIDPIYWNYLP